MSSEKHLFNLPEDIHYLNCAYMSPQLTEVEEAGILGIKRKRDPSAIKSADFFNEQVNVKIKFGKLVTCDAEQVAIIPSVSYGLSSAVKNIPVNSGNHAITVSDDFPSDYFTITDWCKLNKKELRIIQAPETRVNRGQLWTEKILDSINRDTSAVVMSAIHWTDGTKFDLKKIGLRCKEVNALFIVDGTQSVGAMEMNVAEFRIDALICCGYKWLLGPYSIGLAYYSEYFNTGTPLENSWMNKSNAEDFTKLTDYTDTFKKGAYRFNVGESSNFILLPMLSKALDQVLRWEPHFIQEYCGTLIKPLTRFLKENNYWVEEDNYRSNHLFGILLPKETNRNQLLQVLQEKKIIVSVRGDSIRVSPHLYNTADDMEALTDVLKKQNGS